MLVGAVNINNYCCLARRPRVSVVLMLLQWVLPELLLNNHVRITKDRPLSYSVSLQTEYIAHYSVSLLSE